MQTVCPCKWWEMSQISIWKSICRYESGIQGVCLPHVGFPNIANHSGKQEKLPQTFQTIIPQYNKIIIHRSSAVAFINKGPRRTAHTPLLVQRVQERLKARKEVGKNPTRENNTDFNKMARKVRPLTKFGKKKDWTETCSKLDPTPPTPLLLCSFAEKKFY